ncbi:MAG: hypothetical protein M0P38_04460 [Bacteroidales bacterium]|jgi:hypothetical protein|nr:hypothetical protein [Bacteroidales bacterium]
MKNSNSFFCFLLIILSVCLLAACKDPQTPTQQTASAEDYPIITISDSSFAHRDAKLYALSSDFVKNFLLKADDYQGTKRTMLQQVPTEWGLIGIERLPQGRELWLIQSQDREWTYLVITSGSGTQRILDVAPIELDLAREENNAIEREWWTWHREEDGAFIVDKSYEWKKSIEDATAVNVHDYFKSAYSQDKYVIGEMGRFDCFPTKLNDSVYYNAVVFFSGHKPSEEWKEKTEYLEAFCEQNNLLFSNVHHDYKNVLIQDYTFNPIDTVDVTPYITKDSLGMLLFENGQLKQSVSDRSIQYLEMQIKKNFKTY